MDLVAGAGDLSGDGIPDVLARDRRDRIALAVPSDGVGLEDAHADRGRVGRHGRRPRRRGPARATGDPTSWRGSGRRGTCGSTREPRRASWARVPGSEPAGGSSTRSRRSGDLNHDTLPDIVARERSTGYLWLYARDDHGLWRPRVKIGTGWKIFDVIS